MAVPAYVSVAVEHTKLAGTARRWDPMVWVVAASPSLKPKG